MLISVIEHLDSDADKIFIEKIYNEYMPFFRSRVYMHLHDINICNDLAHDCMVSMIKHIDTLKALPENKLRAYLTISIDNTVRNYLKQTKKQVRYSTRDLTDDYSLADETCVEDTVEQKFEYQVLRQCVDGLNERDKSLLTMKYDLELGDEQIADAMGLKKDSVRMTVSRSVAKLKKNYAKQEESL